MNTEIIAKRYTGAEYEAFPASCAWEQVGGAAFCTDWRGESADDGRKTEVRMLWSPETVFLRFDCCYRELVTFETADDATGRRDGLWERDVAEVFLQPDRFGSRYYTEFEVAPNGMWVDLEIHPGGRRALQSNVRCRAQVEGEQVWTAEVSIPMRALTSQFDPAQPWRVNFFRCEGSDPARWYSAWRPTHTPEPNFHVPEAFGVLRFEE